MREIFERYAGGESVPDIIRSLDERGVQSKHGGQLHINSFRNMIMNRKYIGEYKFGDTVIADAIPPIVPLELFSRAQERLEKNRMAPTTKKAKVEYLLATKLHCGKCGAYMVGESGISRGVTYNYYKCASNKRKKGCDQKRAVKKDWIEQLVVRDTVDAVLQDAEIKRIAGLIMDLQKREDTALPLLQRELVETKNGLNNIADAIQKGIITNTTRQRLEELEARQADLEAAILQGELQKNWLTEEQIVYWISLFKGGDIADKAYQRAIIDIFVNAVYIFDDKIVFTYNFRDDTKTIELTDIENSDLPQSTPANGTKTNPESMFVGEAFVFVFDLPCGLR